LVGVEFPDAIFLADRLGSGSITVGAP
jgi:hypothetical protein